jgi:mannonate dehydratase
VPNFDLFLRLMSEKRYEGLLFADISAMTQYNRIGRPLTTILQREDLHERLVNGSDYPLPAVNLLIRTRALVQQGYITKDERACLNEIYDYNPLLFDFALKRSIKLPGTQRSLSAKVFMRNAAIEGKDV